MKKLTYILFLTILSFFNCAMFNSISQSSQSSQSISTSMQSISTMFNSVSSISGSISSISTSSSKNTEDNPKKSQYRRDVRDLTYLSIKSGSTHRLEKNLETLGLRHGISDWRNEENSFLGIGEGLKKAGSNQNDLEYLASSLPGSQSELLKSGYSK